MSVSLEAGRVFPDNGGMALFQPLFAALNEAEIRYVVVGGLAVVLHGHARLTADVDLVVDLEPAPAARTIDVLTGLGFKPRLPVDAAAFADVDTRRSWIEDRGMRVFSLFDPENPLRAVDLFVEHVIEFEELWSASELIEIPGASIRVADIPHLIRLKEMAGRDQDLTDIEQLKAILKGRDGASDG